MPDNEKMLPVKVLLLPKFELEELTGDTPGEAQLFYGAYFKKAESYEIRGGFPGSRLYYSNGAAMYITGMGKVNATASLTAVLSDPRFDFSRAYVISTGCAGGAVGESVMGDVYVITAAVDYDIGHHADIRDMEDSKSLVTWFRDASYDNSAYRLLNQELTQKVYDLLHDSPIRTTPRTRRFMAKEFNDAEWALRQPEVRKGTTLSGDNFWKGLYGHANAVRMAESYGCPDPYALSEMEDLPIALVLDRFGMLDRYIIIRACVNMDVFMSGGTPEKLWRPDYRSTMIAGDDNCESADIFPVAMENNFHAVSRVIDNILNGDL